MRLVFAGTPEFAVPALEALLASEHQVVAVWTQPDRRKGRGQTTEPSPVKQCAQRHHLPVHQPKTLGTAEAVAELADYQPDIMVVVAYGLLLPEPILSVPTQGCLNIHASLLPRWRGAAPIEHAIWAGDTTTGVSIMQMDRGMDTGPVWRQAVCAIAPQDTAGTLAPKLAALGAQTLMEHFQQSSPVSTPQEASQVTMAPKITPEQRCLDWQQPALSLERQIRALQPHRVVHTSHHDRRFRIWSAQAHAWDHTARPGTVLARSALGVDVATGAGILRLMQLQAPGKPVMLTSAWLHGHPQDFAVGSGLY